MCFVRRYLLTYIPNWRFVIYTPFYLAEMFRIKMLFVWMSDLCELLSSAAVKKMVETCKK